MPRNKVLDEAVAEYADSDEILHIGSASGFFFIGTAAEYEKEIDEMSTAWINYFHFQLDKCRKTISRIMTTPVTTRKDEVPSQYGKRLAAIGKQLCTELAAEPKHQSHIDEFRSMRDRKVIEVYRRIEDNTVAIIVSGDEQGSFWNKAEWDSAKSHYPGQDQYA